MNVKVLILAHAATAAALRRVLEHAGAIVDVAASTDDARERLDRLEHDALALGVGVLAAADGLRQRCEEEGVELALVVDGQVQPQHYERAFELGAAGVLGTGCAGGAARSLLERVAERRASWAGRQEEVRRWRVQSEELRRRCRTQAEKFHETQETFYLDLSRMMTIITNIMDGVVFVDRDGLVTLMNPVAEELLGAKSFEAIGKSVAELRGNQELVDVVVADHDRVGRRGEEEVVRTVELHHDEQDLLYIKCSTSCVLDYEGQPSGTLIVLCDVTEGFKTDQLKNQYLSIVAHELRTPLTGIKTFATMMAKGTLGDLNERQSRVCDSIKEQSLRLEHQIDKLINLGNLESEDYGKDREVVDLQDFLAGLLLPFEQPARDRQIELSMSCEVTEGDLFADRSDLRRACQALIENAVKFAKEGGVVEVRVAAEADGLRFGVRDDGIGVDPRYHRRIFEKFFQVEDPLTRHHGGAGLGLFVASGIVEAHGSRLEVSSQLGKGADFSFMLPVYRPELASVEVGGGARPTEAP
jgi:PAS domain S-box-containing protein